MKYISLILIFSISLTAFSSPGIGTGKVTGIIPYKNGTKEMFFIKIEDISNSPSCNDTLRFTMTSADPSFKGTYSAVLAALMSGMEVKATGLGTCNNFSNSEDLHYICLGDTPC